MQVQDEGLDYIKKQKKTNQPTNKTKPEKAIERQEEKFGQSLVMVQ